MLHSCYGNGFSRLSPRENFRYWRPETLPLFLFDLHWRVEAVGGAIGVQQEVIGLQELVERRKRVTAVVLVGNLWCAGGNCKHTVNCLRFHNMVPGAWTLYKINIFFPFNWGIFIAKMVSWRKISLLWKCLKSNLLWNIYCFLFVFLAIVHIISVKSRSSLSYELFLGK